MRFSLQKVKRIKKQFEKKYFFTKPYLEYVNACGISKVGIQDKTAPIDISGDYCISVRLRKPLPKNLSLPTEYQGVKVFVQVTGEIRPL